MLQKKGVRDCGRGERKEWGTEEKWKRWADGPFFFSFPRQHLPTISLMGIWGGSSSVCFFF